MDLPNVAALSLADAGAGPPLVPDDIAGSDDKYLQKLKSYAECLPYSIEPNSHMQSMLNLICTRIVQTVGAKDYDPGFLQWDSMLTYWSYLRYPIPKEKRILLVKLYFHLCTTPGVPLHIIASCSDALDTLTRSRKKLSVQDLRLPWQPLLQALRSDLFLTRRQFEVSQMTYYMGHIASVVRRFFHPAAIDEMLTVFLPLMNGTELDSLLSSQYYMLTFLPQSHPQSYMPMLFRVWESVNSYMFDDRMLQFLAKLTEIHLDPSVSDPKKIKETPDDELSPGEGRPQWSKDDLKEPSHWTGIFSDVGIFSENDWHLIMCKCLASMEIPLADSGSLTTGPSADNQAGFELGRLPKPTWRILSLARILVNSMAPDSLPSAPSANPTPFNMTPMTSGMSTPRLMTPISGGPTSIGDYLTAHLNKTAFAGLRTYIGGSKALDALIKLIASTESFFHPSNSGAWTSDLTAFIKYIAYEFNKRWHAEQQPDCKTPLHRRLTKHMKRELVQCLRTVALLSMFSEDSNTVSNVSSCLKWMSLMEPDLILYPILERAVPALENLTETQRTLAVIKALGAIAPTLVSRDVFYPGAKHLVPILQLLIPGIDLNDPGKTLCTTTFLIEVSQYIKFGDLTALPSTDDIHGDLTHRPTDVPARKLNGHTNGDGHYDSSRAVSRVGTPIPSIPAKSSQPHGRGRRPTLAGTVMPSQFLLHPSDSGGTETPESEEPQLSAREEDVLLREATGGFTDWIASFIRRVILLFDNLPEESGGSSEVQMVDSVTNACSQICAHLSEPLFDLVLDMVFDFASTNVRPNAVRAVHQLVECVANANPVKTLKKFFSFCVRNIYIELESGASSVRTTSTQATPMPADATFHWNLAILRGAVFNDGKAVLKYKDQLIPLLQLLRRKTYAQRGYSWGGRFLSSLMLTLTHTYPLEDRFMNPEEWISEDFRRNHHRFWGKLYTQDEIKVSWHVSDDAELDFAIEIFKQVVEPAMNDLEALLRPGVTRDSVWRNDFCRYLSYVRNAFAGTPTIVREHISKEDQAYTSASSDILHEIAEMIAGIEPLNAGFAINDPKDPRAVYYNGLRRRFGAFLHDASVSLRQQGEENTVDAVSVLLQSISTYMLNYGDSKDNYYLLKDRYNSELNYALQYPGQKAWPRSVFIRRARLYNAARLRWSSIERKRGPLEDSLIDDVAEWAQWTFATVRISSQNLLDSLSSSYDGVRRRVIPVLYKSIEPGVEDDRLKGALWTFNSSTFVKYTMGDHALATDALRKIFACQAHEKPSIQTVVAAVAENGINSFVEPNFLVYALDYAPLERTLAAFRAHLAFGPEEEALERRVVVQREERVKLWEESVRNSLQVVLDVASAKATHWRYAIFATRCLRTMVRKDAPTSEEHVKYFLNKAHDSQPTLRYYSQRAIMKVSRYIKLRTFAKGPEDLVHEHNSDPLKGHLTITGPAREFTAQFLADFRKPLDAVAAGSKPVLVDRATSGWIAWGSSITAYRLPDVTSPSLAPWRPDAAPALAAVRAQAEDDKFWRALSVHYAAENHADTVVSDNMACVKSVVQLLEGEPFKPLRALIEELLAKQDQNKQRGGAELLAGLLSGAKHWPRAKADELWGWALPLIKTALGSGIKTDTLPVWTSFLEYIFFHKDPRRPGRQELLDHVLAEFNATDYNDESSLRAVKALAFFRAFYEEQGWKFNAWADDAVQRVWGEMASEHDDVRAYISDLLTLTDKIKWAPTPSKPTPEVFVRECRTLPVDADIMGSRGAYHLARVHELVAKFPGWRAERPSGTRAFQSRYDRVGVSVCRWLFQMVHGTHAVSVFDYIVPLMPELFRFTELNDNNDLRKRAKVLLVRMCGVNPPRPLVGPILHAIFDAIQKSPSWRVRLQALPLVQVFYFRQVPLITDAQTTEILEVLCKCLDDEVVEVREMAATTLSGILRLSPRRAQLTLKERFLRLLRRSPLPRPPLRDAAALRRRHAAILGICALVESYPYTVERWMPELLTGVLAEHTFDPIPVSSTVRRTAASFKRTHFDVWAECEKRFTEEQLGQLSTLLTGSSYYA
ncbi:hypothetical protein PENSPDRAFT_621096 [Peniophora sp. CONT]|nr:hypothetical protein PENSPDRAFT_621096 [Peniophora sp. CONT]